jgi:signal transduction histidine kinase
MNTLLTMRWRYAAGAAIAALLVFDLDTGLFRTPLAHPWLGWATAATVLLATVAWLWPHPALAVLAATGSIVLTFTNPAPETNWGLAETAALFGVLLVTTMRARSWWLTPVVLLVVAALVTQPMQNGAREISVIFGLVILVIALGLVAAVGYVRLIETARLRQVAGVKAEQRAEFARDLHDFVAHHVTGMIVLAQGARRVVVQSPRDTELALGQIEAAGGEAMTAMRRMVGVLRDDMPVTPLAGIDELGPLVDGFGRPPARLQVDGQVTDLPVEVTSSVYRVVMESLTNVRKHAAEATAVDVNVQRTPEWVIVRVTNDGRTSRAESKGFGLLGLTERVQALGGRIKAGPGIDGGWVVDAALPLAKVGT